MADLDADHLDRIRREVERGFAPTIRDTQLLLAEVERLRADSVPRSALVRLGRFRASREPVYVIRKDSDE